MRKCREALHAGFFFSHLHRGLLPLEGATNKVWEQGKFLAPDKKKSGMAKLQVKWKVT